MPTSRIRLSGFDFHFHFWFHLPANVHLTGNTLCLNFLGFCLGQYTRSFCFSLHIFPFQLKQKVNINTPLGTRLQVGRAIYVTENSEHERLRPSFGQFPHLTAHLKRKYVIQNVYIQVSHPVETCPQYTNCVVLVIGGDHKAPCVFS